MNQPAESASEQTQSLVLRPSEIESFARGSGVLTVPLVGHWNCTNNTVTTGTTTFPPDAGIPLHTHNVEETILILQGLASVQIGDERFDLVAGEATWAAARVPHRFENRGDSEMTIYWVYGGREVTRTNCETGVTVVHLSDADRGASVSPSK